MKKYIYILTALITAFAMTACSNDDDFDSHIVTHDLMKPAPEVMVFDLTSKDYGIWMEANDYFYKDLAKKSGKAIKGFDKLPPNDFATVTISNIDEEIRAGHLSKIAAAYPLQNWKDCKMVIVCGCFTQCRHMIESTHVIKSESNHYYILLDANLPISIEQAFGPLFCTAYIFPNKKAKVDFEIIAHGSALDYLKGTTH